MSSVKDIPFDNIRIWVRVEKEKGRLMRDIVSELATLNDVTVLRVKDSLETRHQLLVDVLGKTSSRSAET
jgi:hypothetical protein